MHNKFKNAMFLCQGRPRSRKLFMLMHRHACIDREDQA